MAEIKHKYHNTPINPAENLLYNIETSELQVVKNAYLTASSPTGEVSINYQKYVYMDTDRLKTLLSKGLKQVDLALLTSISNRFLNRYNIVMQDEEKPHTTATIAELVGETPHSVRNKIKRLIEKGLLAYQVVEAKKKWGKVYIVNPHFIRKGREFKEFVTIIFKDII